MLITFAVIFSLLVGCSQFVLGISSLDQVIFGWLLGSWLAFTYFTLVRKFIHNHVEGLMSGRTTSSNKMYYLISTCAWLGIMLILSVVFLIVRDNELDFAS